MEKEQEEAQPKRKCDRRAGGESVQFLSHFVLPIPLFLLTTLLSPLLTIRLTACLTRPHTACPATHLVVCFCILFLLVVLLSVDVPAFAITVTPCLSHLSLHFISLYSALTRKHLFPLAHSLSLILPFYARLADCPTIPIATATSSELADRNLLLHYLFLFIFLVQLFITFTQFGNNCSQRTFYWEICVKIN
jgi:hypothetical protein